MVKRRDFGWVDIYANQYWYSIQLIPSISMDYTKGLWKAPQFRKISITFAFLPWWLTLEFRWQARLKKRGVS